MFHNIAPLDFSLKDVRANMQAALEELDTKIKDQSLQAKIIINGEEKTSNTSVKREDPSNLEITFATIFYANIDDCKESLKLLKNSHSAWSNVKVETRSDIIKQAARIMLTKRYELSAVIIRETGKPWKEADADVVEAIDFCNYYAEQALKFASAVKTDNILGEDNFYLYKSKGCSLIIPPWNFPLAIACGMLTAALVTGNPAILKPAEQSSYVAYLLCKILLEAGVPKDVLAFLPGKGEEIGRFLVESPEIHTIAFTGSKAVGLEIIEKASKVQAQQRHIKKVIAELGGKNAIVVDEDADLDQAIKGILYSAFGYAGQKCSACSRVIAHKNIYHELLERLKPAVQDLLLGNACNPENFLGPVIDKDAYERIQKTIEQGKASHSFFSTPACSENGYFISPTVFYDCPINSELWKQEIFGPVLTICEAENFAEAINLAIDSEYALTGGVFSRSPANINYAKQNFLVGNLYINRGCTGAIVQRQPFGGFQLSGIGSKAGGPDYLLQFLEPRVISENTVRRGFAPELA